jgi:hypothetical protein
MFYTDPQSRKAFTADARTLYAQPRTNRAAMKAIPSVRAIAM